MHAEKIVSLVDPRLPQSEQLSRVNYLLERHGVLVDRLKNNTGRPPGKKPGLWPCQVFEEVSLMFGPGQLKEIFDDVSAYETCHNRRAKLTLSIANNLFHSQPEHIKRESISQFEKFGTALSAYKSKLQQETSAKKK